MTSSSLDLLAEAFGARRLPKDAWTHEAHLRVGAWHVHRFGGTVALERLRVGIRALNDAHGVANTATGGYHETITAAYVRLLEQFLAGTEPGVPLEDGVSRLLSSPLAGKQALLRFWSKELLLSPRARAEWVPPDLEPLTL